MVEKTGIQMIEELLGNMVVLDRRVQVVEQLLKQLLSIANPAKPTAPALIQAAIRAASIAEANSPDIVKTSPPDVADAAQEPPLIKAAPNARVMGKITGEKKAIPNVNITVYDDRDNPIRNTRTNHAGEWQLQLPPGKYVAQCVLEGRVNGNVVFSVGRDDRIVRVGQPT
jgi:hypothetical protein